MQVTAYMTRRHIIKRFHQLLNIVKTTSFMSSLLFTFIFSLVTAFAMFLIYRTAKQEIAEQIDNRLFSESNHIIRQFQEKRSKWDFQLPQTETIERVIGEEAMNYCLISFKKFHEILPNNQLRNEAVLFNFSGNNICQLSASPNDESTKRGIIRLMNYDYVLIVTYDIKEELGILNRMRSTVLTASVILLLLSFFGTLVLSGRITQTIATIRRTARKIMDGDFSRRIQTNDNNSDELTLLSKDLNKMLDKLDNLITSQRQVTNNIAHDLRSPLNRLRNRMEVSLLDKKIDCDQLRVVIAESIEDADNLLKTFNALLNIAQVESRAKNDFAPTNITQICDDLAELYDVLVEDGEHQFIPDIQRNLQVLGNKHLLAQAITNLLDNAVKYTPNGGLITLQCWADEEEQQIIVAVSDNGAGIPADKFQEVLKRFVRLDSARSTAGNGLGLSLVSAVVDLHNGELKLSDNQPGLRVQIHLPMTEYSLAIIDDEPPFDEPLED